MPIADGFGDPARATIAAAARRVAGTSQRASLRNRADAAGASARACQHLEAPARARLWRQSRVAHAAADGRWYAAEPPGPRGSPSWCLDQPPGRALRAFEASLGPGGPGFVVGGDRDRSIRTHDPRFTKSPFCHGLLAAPVVKVQRSTETGDAPAWQGEKREHTGSIRPMNNAARRDAAPVECSWTFATGC